MQNDNNHKNLAAAILENGGYSSDTSLTIPATSAATFPDVPFFATIMPTTDLANSNNSEIVEVTATSTSGSDTTFTISRGQRGTTAINWDAGKAVLVHAIYTEDVVYIDTTLSTPTNIAYVSEGNIQDGAVTTSKIANGAVTSDKIDWATISTLLFSGDAVATQISLSQRVDDFGYLVFLVRSAINDSAPKYFKFPTRATIGSTTDAARYRYTLSVPFMSANGAIGMDCVQYIVNSQDGKTLSVKYQGYNVINPSGTINTSTTTNIHVVKIYGTDVL